MHAVVFQPREVGFAGAHGVHDAAQDAGQQQGLFPLCRSQVAIAAGERQACLVTLGFTADHVDRQSELLDHIADHHQLLVVLFAEQGGTRLGDCQQLHDHRTHPDEKAGAEVAFQNICQLSRRVHLECLRLRVKLALFGGKHNIATRSFQVLAICFQGPGVGVEILVRCKLQPVHKDGGNRHVAQRLGLAHQGQVPGMQVAHGGHDGWVTVLAECLA